MALIVCCECNNQYSDRAPSCIHCGCPTEVNLSPTEPEIQPEFDTGTEDQALAENLTYSYPKSDGSEWFNKIVLKKKIYYIFYAVVLTLVMCVVVSVLEGNKPVTQKATTTKSPKSKPKHHLLESSARVESRFNDSEVLYEMQRTIRSAGYRCDSFSAILEMNFTRGFTAVCNNYNYRYEVADVGGKWVVTVD